jgi:3-oxoacyl-[acyl-carrier protein] reductase
MFKEDFLKDKVVLVTGGSRGIGRAVVELFAGLGAKVIFFYRSQHEVAETFVSELKEKGLTVVAQALDVANSQLCQKAVEDVIEKYGQIDILINNAGIIKDNLLVGLSDEDVSKVLETNVIGTFNMSRAVIPYMMSQKSGNIVNVSSVSAAKGGRGQSNYAASKGAIESFTRTLAVELARKRIRVNAVAPGVIETDMSQAVREMAGDQVLSEILLKRYGKPEEVASAILFLASEAANYINGVILPVDGGFKMR